MALVRCSAHALVFGLDEAAVAVHEVLTELLAGRRDHDDEIAVEVAWHQAFLSGIQGRYAAAARGFAAVRMHAERSGQLRHAALAAVNQGIVMGDMGVYESSLELVTKGMDASLSVNRHLWLAYAVEALRAHVDRGDLDRADHVAAQIAADAPRAGMPRELVYRARLAYARGDYQRAIGLVEDMELAESGDAVVTDDQVLGHEIHARVLVAMGRFDEALVAATMAMEGLVAMSIVMCDEGRVYLTYARALQAAGHGDRARAVVDRAYRVLQERARHIDEPEWQASYWAIAAHREIVEWHAAAGR